MPTKTGRSAVFLDRDGTIIEDTGYPSDPDQVRLISGVADAIRHLRESGLAAVIVSNQSGVGRGLFSIQDLKRVQARTSELLAAQGVELDGAYYCPHAPSENCDCRKPATGLIDRARSELGLSANGCLLIGNSASDIQAGAAADCETILLGSADLASVTPTWRVSSWNEIVDLLAARSR